MAVLIFLGCLLGGIAIGLPIAWALLLCGAALMFWLDMFDVQIMAQTLVNGADSFSLLAIPFFVLAGEIMNAGGLSKRIVDLPMKLVGHKPGGLGYVGVLAAMIMASLSGSAVADTAAVAALLVPMMRSANYPVNRAAGLIASGGIQARLPLQRWRFAAGLHWLVPAAWGFDHERVRTHCSRLTAPLFLEHFTLEKV